MTFNKKFKKAKTIDTDSLENPVEKENTAVEQPRLEVIQTQCLRKIQISIGNREKASCKNHLKDSSKHRRRRRLCGST